MSIWKLRWETFVHYLDLVKELVGRDLKLKYRRSVLGYLWSILNPLLIMIIMTIVFSQMFDRNIENYAVYLLAGRTIFEFVNTSTNKAMTSIKANASLIKKVYIPKYVFPFAKVTSGAVECVFTLVALAIVMLVTRTAITPKVLFVPFIILQVYVFTCGLGLFLAQAVVLFKDIQYIYKAFTTAWMYLTPIFYPIEMLPDTVRWAVVNFNPLYSYIAQFRVAVYSGGMFEIKDIILGCTWAVAMLIFGLVTFKRSQDKFIVYI